MTRAIDQVFPKTLYWFSLVEYLETVLAGWFASLFCHEFAVDPVRAEAAEVDAAEGAAVVLVEVVSVHLAFSKAEFDSVQISDTESH